MKEKSLFRVGAIGAIIAAICCFTPALVAVLAAVGLSSLVGFLDIIFLPALVLCIALMFIGYGLHKKKKQSEKNV